MIYGPEVHAIMRRRHRTVLTCLLLALAVTGLTCSCRGRAQATPAATVDPSYVPTSVARALGAAATHRATVASPTATSMAMPPTATPEPPTATATAALAPTEATKLMGAVTSDGLRLRKGPGSMYSALGALYSGDDVEISGRDEAGQWLQVQVADGRSGWVFAEYVDLPVPMASVPIAPEIPPVPQPAGTASS
jgi:uncharacterized protein YraI